MPAAIAVPLISGAIAGGTSIAAAKMGSNAADKAAKTGAAATTEALNWEKQQYADEQARLKPYRDLGSAAYQRMGTMLGIDAPAQPPQSGGGVFSNLAQGAGTFSLARPQPGQTVRIRHPRTGEVREVPASQAEAYKAKGGTVVG